LIWITVSVFVNFTRCNLPETALWLNYWE